MKTNIDKLLYYIGTGLLIIAVIELTLVPAFINNFMPTLFIPVGFSKIVVGWIYFFAALCYVLSKDTTKRQFISILLIFLYYGIFQGIFHII